MITVPYSDELILQQFQRQDDLLERIARALERLVSSQDLPSPFSKQPDMDAYVTEKEASSITGLSKAWFQRKRVYGGGPPYSKVGNSIRYRISDLHGWMMINRVRHTTEWSERKREGITEF
jgi:predicted DNA-binding transcriptional regulator AlpA